MMIDNNRRSTGYGEVPYRGQPEPKGRHGSAHRRKYTPAEKKNNARTMRRLLFLTLIPLVMGVLFLIYHETMGVFVSIVFLLFILFLDAMVISSIKR
jgi:hypothetical protein